MPTDYGAGLPGSTTFAQRLDELGREGANLLLVGDSSPEVHAAGSRRLLEGGDDSHRHLFVFTEGANACTSLPDGADPANTHVVRQPSEDSRLSGWPSGVSETVLDDPSPSALATGVVEAIDDLVADEEGVELRLCFDSITSLVRDRDSEEAFRIMHLVTTHVRQVGGIGHYHLALARDDDHVRLLEPVFDAVVELRSGEAGPEQRWHFQDDEMTSDWVDL